MDTKRCSFIYMADEHGKMVVDVRKPNKDSKFEVFFGEGIEPSESAKQFFFWVAEYCNKYGLNHKCMESNND